jgi:hypothetical protein
MVVIEPEPPAAAEPEDPEDAEAAAGAAAVEDDDDELLQAAANSAQADARETAVAARHLRPGLRCPMLARLLRGIALLPRYRRSRDS